MNGRTQLLLGCVLLIAAGGCDDAPPPHTSTPGPTPLAEAFDPATTGTITGRVVWEGDVPLVPSFRAPVHPSGEAALMSRHDWPNPNAPVIDATGRGVVGAVVFLRGVDPQRSRPWDFAAARVEIRDYDYRVRQGGDESRIGFVQRGSAVEFVSRQSVFHAVRARGDAFFTLALPDAEQSHERVFDRPGVVELSSAAGYFWARLYLFVAETPYYARTNADGRFTLPQVPPGEYELVCWLPNWHEQARELDGDSFQITRLRFQPAVEEVRKVSVVSGKVTQTGFTLSAAKFTP